MTTRRENLQAVLAGRTPAWTPCAINFKQWFTHHHAFGTLPDDLAGFDDYIDAMKALGSDIFSRNLDAGVRETLVGVDIERREEPGPTGPCHTTIYHTPHGDLRNIEQAQSNQSTSYRVEDPVKDWQRDGKAYLWLLDQLQCTWDREVFKQVDARVGDDGLVLVPVGRTPLKQLHTWFGLDYACLFVMDEPQAAKQCCDIFWSKLRPVLVELAEDKAVAAACLMDNVDAPFYSPSLCEDYWTPYVREAADLFAQHGKKLFVHACGKLRVLMDVFGESGIHGLEGMAHPPLGDFTPADAWNMPQHFIYNGGFTAHEQVIKTDAQVRDFYQQYFTELNRLPRFIFGAACQTTVHTSWDRIRMAVELCRQYGGSPHGSQ